MGREILSNYQRLANLLRSQKEALEKDDPDRLAALLPLIEKYSKRVAPQQASQGNPPEAAAVIREILQQAEKNQQAYRQRKAHLSEMQAQLQSASRYLEQARRNHPSPRPRAVWTG
ncbi:MAG: hypothetical protein V3T83_08875 [Acidobacteriota bacterium]